MLFFGDQYLCWNPFVFLGRLDEDEALGKPCALTLDNLSEKGDICLDGRCAYHRVCIFPVVHHFEMRAGVPEGDDRNPCRTVSACTDEPSDVRSGLVGNHSFTVLRVEVPLAFLLLVSPFGA